MSSELNSTKSASSYAEGAYSGKAGRLGGGSVRSFNLKEPFAVELPRQTASRRVKMAPWPKLFSASIRLRASPTSDFRRRLLQEARPSP